MGEKSGGLWLIVIVVLLAGMLVYYMSQFYPDAIHIVNIKLQDTLIEVKIWAGIE